MKHKDFIGIVPIQYTGEEIDAEYFVILQNEKEAIFFYEVVKERLLNVNNWHKIAGNFTAKFLLTDTNGENLNRNVQQGDYLKIDIPGPGSSEGDGFDWVFVEDVKEVDKGDMQAVGFRVRPSRNPLGKKNETAHFYSHEATSNFMVTREGAILRTQIIDRNIKHNANVESLTDKIRDIATGIIAIGIFSKMQWQSLVEGLVNIRSPIADYKPP